MKKNPNLLWITAIVLGWLFDLLFWKQSFGINFCDLHGAMFSRRLPPSVD